MTAAQSGSSFSCDGPISLMPINPKRKLCAVRKVIFLGTSGVGKTSLIHRFVATKSTAAVLPQATATTLGSGVDFLVRMAFSPKERTPVKLQLWDTAGQERYGPVANALFRKVDAVVLVGDLSDARGLRDVELWHQRFVSTAWCHQVPMALVGNKSDLPRQVSSQQVEQLAERLGLKYVMDCSAVETSQHELSRRFDGMIDALLFGAAVSMSCAAVVPVAVPLPVTSSKQCVTPEPVVEPEPTMELVPAKLLPAPVSRPPNAMVPCQATPVLVTWSPLEAMHLVNCWWQMDQNQTGLWVALTLVLVNGLLYLSAIS